jgi:hypothetical protein
VLWEAPLLLFRENQPTVRDNVELAVAASFDLGIVLRLGVQLGRETRGPLVVPVSDRAVLDEDVCHPVNAIRA